MIAILHLLGAMLRTALQMITFNVDPALLPRQEAGPLVMVGSVAAVLLVSPAGVVSMFTVLAMVAVIVLLEARRPVAGALAAQVYLLCMAVLIIDLPWVVLAQLEPDASPQKAGLPGNLFVVLSPLASRMRIRRAFARIERRRKAESRAQGSAESDPGQ